MEHSKQNIASLIVLKTQLSYEDEKSQSSEVSSQSSEVSSESENIEMKSDVSAVEALVNLFQLREKAARDSEAMNCEAMSKFHTLLFCSWFRNESYSKSVWFISLSLKLSLSQMAVVMN